MSLSNGSESEYAVDVEDAMSRLSVIPDYDPGDGPGPCVHTFRDGGVGLVGAHWKVDKLRELMDEFGVEEAGPGAAGTGHGLVVRDGRNRALFLETKQRA